MGFVRRVLPAGLLVSEGLAGLLVFARPDHEQVRVVNQNLFKLTNPLLTMEVMKDRVKGPTVLALSLFAIYLILKIVDLAFLSTYKLETSHEVVSLILSIIMVVPTIVFLVFLIKNSVKAKGWFLTTAIIYLLSSVISLFQVLFFPSGNQVITGGSKIGPVPAPVLYIIIAGFYWFFLSAYFKNFSNKFS